ncbi:hypothetical protein TNCV_3144401 [Trichonephila clavipes]|nr:hypothetical protein TNCV_3144401 [Trichonephila clavipes]
MDAMSYRSDFLEYCSFPRRSAISKSRDSSRRPWTRSNASSEYVPNMLDWIHRSGVNVLAIPYAGYCFSFQVCSLPDELYAIGHIIMETKESSNGSNVHTSAYADSTPYHPTSLLYCDLSRTNAGVISSAPVPPIQEHAGCHTLRANRDSSANSNWLQSCCSQSRRRFSNPSSSPHGGVVSVLNTDHWPTCIELLPYEADMYCLAEHPSSLLAARTTVFASCVAFSVLFRFLAFNCIYRHQLMM